jgi:hypothetical protein
MNFRPVHKKTKQAYPVITAEERALNWSKEPYRSHFRFEEVNEPAANEEPAKAPEGVRKTKPTEPAAGEA